MAISPADRRALEDIGKWGEFKTRREELKDEGLTPKMANDQALMELMPEDGVCVPAALGSPSAPPEVPVDIMDGIESVVSALPEKSKPTEMIM